MLSRCKSLEPRMSLVGHSRRFEREVGMTASRPTNGHRQQRSARPGRARTDMR